MNSMKNIISILILVIIIFTGKTYASTITYSHLTDGYWQVWVMDENGENKKQITQTPTDKRNPSWINKGQQLTFRDNNSRLFIVDPSTSAEQEALPQYNNISETSFSDTKQEIIFVRFEPTSLDRNQIWKTNLMGQNATILTQDPMIKFSPQFSSQGEKIVYSKKTEDRKGSTIWIMNSDGTEQKQLTKDTVKRDSMPDFSPDDRFIVYASNRTEDYEINLLDLNSKKITNLSNNPAFDAFPRFTADGKNIVFVSNRSGNRHIWIMDRDGKNPKQLTDGPNESIEPSAKK